MRHSQCLKHGNTLQRSFIVDKYNSSHVWSQLNPATSAREIPKRSQMSLSSNYEQASSDYRPGKH
jgi:hypothetical protein